MIKKTKDQKKIKNMVKIKNCNNKMIKNMKMTNKSFKRLSFV